mmetsp:Transcript_1787/g.3063  ORF Transcript_1787/g.3063 Transcript_1787/m.3063 type:complete len:260 (+) Transcript_1787:69-848(+)
MRIHTRGYCDPFLNTCHGLLFGIHLRKGIDRRDLATWASLGSNIPELAEFSRSHIATGILQEASDLVPTSTFGEVVADVAVRLEIAMCDGRRDTSIIVVVPCHCRRRDIIPVEGCSTPGRWLEHVPRRWRRCRCRSLLDPLKIGRLAEDMLWSWRDVPPARLHTLAKIVIGQLLRKCVASFDQLSSALAMLNANTEGKSRWHRRSPCKANSPLCYTIVIHLAIVLATLFYNIRLYDSVRTPNSLSEENIADRVLPTRTL